MYKVNNDKLPTPFRFSDHIIRESVLLVESKRDIECPDYGKFITVKESEYSCLMPYHAKQVADIIETYFKGRKNINNILDATANIGCDTINFINRFDASCISLEVDLVTYKCLVKNQKNFNIESNYLKDRRENFSVHCNCIEFIKGFKKKMDFVYFDPPWGGICYTHKKTLMLFLKCNGESIPIYTVVRSVFEEGFTKTVIVKIPNNFNTHLFVKQIGENVKCEFHDIMKPIKKGSYIAYSAFSIMICSKLSIDKIPIERFFV